MQHRTGLADACEACDGEGEECEVCSGHGVIAHFRFHDMRHTYATISLAADIDLFTVSRRMGHSSISVTADKYGHLYTGNGDDAEALDEFIKRSA